LIAEAFPEASFDATFVPIEIGMRTTIALDSAAMKLNLAA
jgi:hypothetical protein